MCIHVAKLHFNEQTQRKKIFFRIELCIFLSSLFSTISVKQKKIRIKRTEATTVNAMIMVSGYFGFFDASWSFVIENVLKFEFM